ncbi:large subunit ribosomal protein L15 [Desulfonauticus submarinus]|uniref:Large ribosomal subunit protein uL15 n=1 Tax=Desulfonauticus submarinus TaxID=206665 RepID=A0A1H0G4H5_9BACT|nr:50S ribosomal protein L15 [Desulfonauticus submarinus]SDO01744.1 large subunit ribosomal protein L15 [Desulfonauticus submarinus]
MKLHELYPFEHERKGRKRVGRGDGSGHGGTSCRGHKGQKSRSGGKVARWFEGGQMPLQRRLPKRGFKNPFRVEYAIVNLGSLLQKFEDKEEISIEDIYASGLVKKTLPVKILGEGEVRKAIKITAHKFSKSAKEKIEKAGGSITQLEG